MSQTTTYPDLDVTLEGHVATVEIRRPPHNFFDTTLISTIADDLPCHCTRGPRKIILRRGGFVQAAKCARPPPIAPAAPAPL